MKRIALLVLVFAAAAIAEDGIKDWAEDFESNEETVKMCLTESGTTEMEIQESKKMIAKIQDDIDDDTKKALEKYNNFIACMLEKTELMKDSKLEVDKLMKRIEENKSKENIAVNLGIVRECINALNEDNELTREDRAMGVIVCLVAGTENKDDKKK